MTKADLATLKKYETKRIIDSQDMPMINYLRKLKLIKVDDLYRETVGGVVFEYAEVTEDGKSFIVEDEPVIIEQKHETFIRKIIKRFFK